MTSQQAKYMRFGAATVIIIVALGYLTVLGFNQSKDYYVTIKELKTMGDDAHTKRLRVAGNVQPGSIKRHGDEVDFTLVEEGNTLPVVYRGTEAPPDTFKDDSQALAIGEYGRDGVFHARDLQAKCASKYAPAQQQPGSAPAGTPAAPQKTAANPTS